MKRTLNFDSLADWLRFLEARRPEHEMVLGLERAASVARTLLPSELFSSQRSVRIITVGGTNGKGSTVATLSAILKAAGIRHGAWTSPHLHQFNERIRIDGEMVSDQQICSAFQRLEQARGQTFLSYYEFGTLAALDIFAREQVDVILLEVGLGGRLDTVNILDADISAVVTVDLDHQAWLGDTVEKIAQEKAGIFRAGRPAICGESQPASSLRETISALGAIGLIRAEAFQEQLDATGEQMTLSARSADGSRRELSRLPVPPLPLPSVLCALQALVWLFPEISEPVYRQGLAQARLAGRCQRVEVRNSRGDAVTVLLDVAHNPQAAGYLAEKVKHLRAPRAVLAMLDDKDAGGVMGPLKGCFQHWHVASVDYKLRARSGGELVRLLRHKQESASCYPTVADALGAALEESDEGDTLVVLGSFHTVAEALDELNSRMAQA